MRIVRRLRLALPSLVLAGAATTAAAQTPDSAALARRAHLDSLTARIAGRESQPAGSVFRNVKLLGEVPAGRLLRIMDLGYGRALGVSCDHCHDPAAWEEDGKAAKRIARDMIRMAATINAELLRSIPDLQGREPPPIVNCTTCHRGQVKPALNLGG